MTVATEALHLDPPANTQEAYERIVEWFSQEGVELAKASNGGIPICHYRYDGDPNSPSRCAIGCQIPNSLYNPSLDYDTGTNYYAISLSMIHKEYAPIRKFFSNTEYDFMAAAQSAHDEAESVEDFLSRLRAVAEHHGLTVK